MAVHQKQVDKIVADSGYAQTRMSTIGSDVRNSTANAGRIFMRMKPRGEQPSADEIIEKLRPKFAHIRGIAVYMQNLPPIRIGGNLTKSQYQYTLQSPDIAELYDYVPKLESELRKLPQLQDVTSDLQIKNPQISVDIDRDKAAALGVTAQQIEQALYTAYGPRLISTIYTPNNEYKVVTELEPQFQLDPSALYLLYIRSTQWYLVPLATVATLKDAYGTVTLNHLGLLHTVTIRYCIKLGADLGTATRDVDAV